MKVDGGKRIMQLRLCFVESALRFATRKDASGYSKSVSGPLKGLLDEYIGAQMLQHHNISLLYYGIPQTPDGDACLHALAQDKADVTDHRILFPVIHENVTQGPVTSQYGAAFLTAYNPNFYSDAPNVLEFVKRFSPSFIGLFISSLLIICFVSYAMRSTRRRKRRKRICSVNAITKLLFASVTYIIGDFHHVAITKMKLLLLMMMIASASFRFHTGAVMNTEQVIRTNPLMLTSVSALIDHNVPFIFSFSFEIPIVKRSPDPEIRKIMEMSEARGLNKTLIGAWLRPSAGTIVLQEMIAMRAAPIISDSAPYNEYLCVVSLITKIDIRSFRVKKIRIRYIPHPLTGVALSERLVTRNNSISRLVQRAVRITGLEAEIAPSFLNRRARIMAHLEHERAKIDSCKRDIICNEMRTVMFTPSFTNYKLLVIICGTCVSLISLQVFFEVCKTRHNNLRRES
jgi:cytochrome bd-type quinol oxidase subunit 1